MLTNIITTLKETVPWLLELIGSGVIFIIFLGISIFMRKKGFPTILKHLKKKNIEPAITIIEGFSVPVVFFLAFAGFCCALMNIEQAYWPSFLVWFHGYLPKLLKIFAIYCIAWGLFSSSDAISYLLRNIKNEDINIRKLVTHFFAGIFKAIVVALAITMILKELNVDISGVITGLGLGGLTVALAAKDSAANFFAGLVLVLEHPFEIGDWISCGTVSGTIVDISIRSTLVRTDTGSLMTVPNSVLSNAPINNFGNKARSTQNTVRVILASQTSENDLEQYVLNIKAVLNKNDKIVSSTMLVYLSDVVPNGYVITVTYDNFLKEIPDSMQLKEDVNLVLLSTAQKMNINLFTNKG